MKATLSAALILGLTTATAVSAAIVTVPVSSWDVPMNLNSESLTRRYLQKRQGSSTNVPLTNVENDIIYTIPLGLGSPAQNFNLAIDTGSPITWVSASSCTTGGCANSKTFNCAASSTCTTSTASFNASYVSGQGVSGTYVADTFTVGQLQFRAVAGIVTTNDAPLPTTVDGIMGLWYYAPGSQIPILNVLANSTTLTQNMIGIYLTSSNSKSTTSTGGEITFGGVNTARFTGDISYTNCVSSRPWSIPVGGMTVGGKAISVTGAIAAIDTGTTAMLMPQTVADQINGAIPGAVQVPNQGNIWILPCSGTTAVTITFGSFTGTIPYTSLAMQSTSQSTSQGNYCLSAAMFPTGQTATIDEWLIGDAFLKNVYSVFDFSTNAASGGRIGFASLGSGGGSTSNGTTGSGGSTGSGSTKSSASSVKDASFVLQTAVVVLVAGSALLAGL
ncbi:aspartic peptidase domain-containing protein [Dissophora ornata]|nr:aspartic peptidase domain-containing protein [Dissophora ornata]